MISAFFTFILKTIVFLVVVFLLIWWGPTIADCLDKDGELVKAKLVCVTKNEVDIPNLPRPKPIEKRSELEIW